MGLLKRSDEAEAQDTAGDRRHRKREFPDLIEELESDDPAVRRWAARDLVGFDAAVDPLCRRLAVDDSLPVREAILASLLEIGGEAVAARLVPLLRSDDAALRNGVIEVLQGLPAAVAPQMQSLLTDEDSDVRIFAIDILQVLQHDETPSWLLQVIVRDEHINVVAAAIDRLAEVGTPEMVPALLALEARWHEQPFIKFAIQAAVRRMRGI